jgi:hypothetical protein
MAADFVPLSFDPSRPDFAPYGLTCVHWRPSPMRRPDHHNEVELNFLESGSVTYLLGGTKTVVEAGRLSVFWAAIPHQIIDFGTETAYYVATIPLQCFLQWRLPEKFVQPLMQGRLVSEQGAGSAGSDVQLFERWESDFVKKSPELERPVLLEMQARLIRLALGIPEQDFIKTRTLHLEGRWILCERPFRKLKPRMRLTISHEKLRRLLHHESFILDLIPNSDFFKDSAIVRQQRLTDVEPGKMLLFKHQNRLSFAGKHCRSRGTRRSAADHDHIKQS